MRSLLLPLGLLAACAHAPARPEADARVVLVTVPRGWPSGHRAWIAEAVDGFRAPGLLAFRAVPAGGEVSVEHWVSPDCRAVLGGYDPARRAVLVDPVCLTSRDQWLRHVRHELCHAVGAGHVTPPAYADALLSPSTPVDRGMRGPWWRAYAPRAPETQPTEVDLREIARALGR